MPAITKIFHTDRAQFCLDGEYPLSPQVEARELHPRRREQGLREDFLFWAWASRVGKHRERASALGRFILDLYDDRRFMNESVQGVFDFESGNMNGYANWRRQQEQRLDAIRAEWQLPALRRVRVRLKNIDGEFEGELRLVNQPATIDRRVPLHMRVDNIDVFPRDIEQCVVIQ